MKKNRMMRLASLLLVCVLLTTSVISGTFAKYTTSVNASDTARVARWGIDSTANVAFDLFDPTYGETVNSQYGDNVIAPGTTKTETVKLTYVGQEIAPEVDYTIDLDVVAEESGVAATIANNPNIDWLFNGVWFDSWDAMIAAINGYHEKVEANNLPAIANAGVQVGWNWKFETDGDTAQDIMDTNMGNAAELAKVTLTIKLTATQID